MIFYEMGSGTVGKGKTLRMKNVSIVSFGGRILCLWVEENCTPTETFI
jgi:hypothetical protein